jgi:mRNA interferase RelE/StbE
MSDRAERRWQIVIRREPERVLKHAPRNLTQRLDAAIRGLAEDPRPRGCKRLEGYENLYRLRVGDWRIIYAIEDEQLVILIVEIAPRGSAYRHL